MSRSGSSAGGGYSAAGGSIGGGSGPRSRAGTMSSVGRGSPSVSIGSGGGGGDEDDEEYRRAYPSRAAASDWAKRTPEDVFFEFDRDGSGELDLEEFMAMLPSLGIIVTDAKAIKMFRQIDTDDSGAIDLDEFKVALYALDPVTGNSLGFEPNKLLTPKDAFEMFDVDGSGSIDEDEFVWVLEYLGVTNLSESKIEKLFKKYDVDNSGGIEYDEFKKIWVRVANVKQELINRGITDFPKWAPRSKLTKMLEDVMEEEEKKERQALQLAKQWKVWRSEMRGKHRVLEAARKRADEELMFALDAAGQVYLFGHGTNNQFDGECRRDGFRGWGKLNQLWNERFHPDVEVRRREEEHAAMLKAARGNIGHFADTAHGKNKAAIKADKKAIKMSTKVSRQVRVVQSRGGVHPVAAKVRTKERLASTVAQRGRQRNPDLVYEERKKFREDIRSMPQYMNDAEPNDSETETETESSSDPETARSTVSSGSWVQGRFGGRASPSQAAGGGDVSSSDSDSDSSSSSGGSGGSGGSGRSGDGASRATASTARSRPGRPPRPPGSRASGGSGGGGKDSVSVGTKLSMAPDVEIPTFGRDIPWSTNELALLETSDSTMTLWGKRVVKVSLSNSVAFALTDTGRLFSWGGRSRMWKSVKPVKDGEVPCAVELDNPDGLTARSKLLMAHKQDERPKVEGELESGNLYEWGNSSFVQTFNGLPKPDRANLLDKSDSSDTSSDSDDSADGYPGIHTARRRKALRHWARAERAKAKGGSGGGGSGSGSGGVGTTVSGGGSSSHLLTGASTMSSLPEVTATLDSSAKTPSKSKFRRLSAVVTSAVKSLASSMGISPERQRAADELKAIETPRLKAEAEEEKYREQLFNFRVVLTYYNVWQPPKGPRHEFVSYYEHVLLPKVTLGEMQNSMRLRGKDPTDRNKLELVELLAQDLALEAQILGAPRQREIRNTELLIKEHEDLKQLKLARELREAIGKLWEPISKKQELVRKEQERLKLRATEAKEKAFEEEYVMNRLRHKAALQDTRLVKTARNRNIRIGISGLTGRAPEVQLFRGGMAARDIHAGEAHAVLLHSNHQVFTWGAGSFGRLGMGGGPSGKEMGRGDRDIPSLVEALRAHRVVQVSAGHSHTAAVTDSGLLFIWGSAVSGKLGLGPITQEFECFAPVPAMVRFRTPLRIKSVSCGGSHSGAVSITGDLYMWGCCSNSRLGIPVPHGVTEFHTPQLVQLFVKKREKVASVSCGTAHTLALTEIREMLDGRGAFKALVPKGGHVYMAGARSICGLPCPVFTISETLAGRACRFVSAGFGHSGAITVEGELYLWGSNRSGCCAQPLTKDILRTPTLATSLYVARFNLGQLPDAVATQSSTYDGHGAHDVLDGNRDGFGVDECNHTMREWYPYWDIDLGSQNTITEINVWNREDSSLDASYPADYYSDRLFPFWVFVAQTPFSGGTSQGGVSANISHAKEKKRFYKHSRHSKFELPFGTIGRYVRVQLESFTYMHVAQIEVFGAPGTRPRVGRVTHVECGKQITAVTMGAVSDPAAVELQYRKAVKADAESAEMLRQLETYHSLYDGIGRGETILACPLCRYGQLCEICFLRQRWPVELPPGPFGHRRRLKSVHDIYTSQRPPTLDREEFSKKEKAREEHRQAKEARRAPALFRLAGNVARALRGAGKSSSLRSVPEESPALLDDGPAPAAFGETDIGPIGVGDLLSGADDLQYGDERVKDLKNTQKGKKAPRVAVTYDGMPNVAPVSVRSDDSSGGYTPVGSSGGGGGGGGGGWGGSVGSRGGGSRRRASRASRRSSHGSQHSGSGGSRRSSRSGVRRPHALDTGAGAGAGAGMLTSSPVRRKKKIGGKLKLNYAPDKVVPTAKPFTDADVEKLIEDNPPVRRMDALTSLKSPQAPRKRKPKIKDGMAYK